MLYTFSFSDGRFIYPPEAAANGRPDEPVLDAPVDSIRFEMLRDGIEDFEYLATLKRLLKSRGHGLSERERKRFEKLLTVPDSISARDTTRSCGLWHTWAIARPRLPT